MVVVGFIGVGLVHLRAPSGLFGFVQFVWVRPGDFGFIPVHSGATRCLLGSFGFVRLIRCAPLGSVGSIGFVRCIRVCPVDLLIRSCSFSSFGSALGVAGLIRVNSFHLGAHWGSLGLVRFVWVCPGGS